MGSRSKSVILKPRVRRPVVELRDQRNSFVVLVGWQTAQLDQSWIDVEQADRLKACLSRHDIRTSNQEWNASGFFPQRALGPVVLFAKMESMIAPQDDQRVVGMRTRFQSIQNNAHAMVDETDGCQPGVRQASLFTVPDDFGMSRRDLVVVDAEKVCRKIVEV